jgi:hypothetical protein
MVCKPLLRKKSKMKKFLICVLSVFALTSLEATAKPRFYEGKNKALSDIVVETCDETAKECSYGSFDLLLQNHQRAMLLHFALTKADEENKFNPKFLIVRWQGDSCSEDNSFFFLQENKKVTEIKSFGGFTCDSFTGFLFDKATIETLSQSPVVRVQFYNGRTRQQFSMDVPPEKSDYFQLVFSVAQK